MVPERKLREVASACILEAFDEILDRHGLTVMAVEIEVHAFLEAVLAEQRRDHARDFAALFVDGRRVEIVDLAICRRPHRVGERAAIFRELLRFQVAHFGDALDGARALVGREFVVAIDRQALLEAQLEPVPAGDAVAGPVVEIFMRDDCLDIGIVGIGGDLWIGKDVFVVEDVEALVLHRAHVEVGDGDDHEDVEIVFAAEPLFVPLHRAFQRVHGIGCARLLAVLDIDLQHDFAAGHGCERVFDDAEIAGDERKEIARLRMRIEPGGEMFAGAVAGAAEEVAVRQKQRVGVLVGDDVDRERRKHVGPVGK